MKILLIYPFFIDPRIDDEDIRPMPMGLYWIGAVLKEAGYKVEILNLYDFSQRKDEIRDILRSFKPQAVGFSVLHGNRWGAVEIARLIKDLFPDTKVIFGGVGATFLWRHLLRHFPEIDFIVLREGEKSFPQLLDVIKEDSEDYKSVPGIAYRSGNKLYRTKESGFIDDLDSLPIPSKYFTYQHVSISRGCPWNCNFCGSPQFWNRRVRFRSPEHFLEEIEILYKKGIRMFYFSDDTFTLNKSKVLEICDLILKKGLKINWNAISRVDQVDEEMLYWMRKAGCIQISYGVESGSEKIRKALNKPIKSEDIIKAFEITKRYGILPRLYLIYGSPGEDEDTIDESIKLMHTIKPLALITYILDLFPGTRFWNEIKKRQSISDDIWLNKIEGIMYFQLDSLISQEMVLSWGNRLRKEFYSHLPQYVRAIRFEHIEDMKVEYSDFLSRLGMTFSHGLYSKNPDIPEKEKLSEWLFKQSLRYLNDRRAYLGLSMLKQKQGNIKEAEKILKKALSIYPEDKDLSLCLAINFMNQSDFKEALKILERLPPSEGIQPYIDECKKRINH